MAFDQKYYDSVYRNYQHQNPDYKLKFYRSLVDPFLNRNDAPSVLDLGCAFGYFLNSLDSNVRRFGMDISHYAVTQASKRLHSHQLVVGDCSSPPFSATFDAIVAFDVLEHVPALDRVPEFVQGSLSQDGVFVFVVPVYDGPLGPIIHWLDKDPTHIHKRSRHWWLNWAQQHFEVIRWTGIMRYLIAPGFYLHIPGTLLRSFSPAIVISARLRKANR